MAWLLSLVKGFGIRLYAIAATAIGVALLILRNRWLVRDRNDEEDRRKRAEAFLKRNQEIDTADAEISNEFADRRRDDKKDNLTDANRW